MGYESGDIARLLQMPLWHLGKRPCLRGWLNRAFVSAVFRTAAAAAQLAAPAIKGQRGGAGVGGRWFQRWQLHLIKLVCIFLVFLEVTSSIFWHFVYFG